MVSTSRVFAARLVGCSVFDPNGEKVGKVRDALVVYRTTASPRVVGFIVEVPGRRRVFLSIGRVTNIGSGQIIATGLINLRRFEQRGGEVRVIAELLGRRMSLRDGSGDGTIEDVAIEETGLGEWEVAQLFLRRPKTTASIFAKGTTVFAAWADIIENRAVGESQSATQLVATYSDLLPADLANAMLDLPERRMLEVAEELSDDRLADVIEEMAENEQVDILNQLDDARAADVLDQVQPDDAADLIAHLSDERGEALLDLMEPEEADDVRFLLSYAPDTAGGLMTTEPVIVSADATVAEGLALIRRHERAPALGAAICVTLPPYEPPTGRFLGMVHFQRMLRYPPNERLGTLLDPSLDPVQAHTSARTDTTGPQGNASLHGYAVIGQTTGSIHLRACTITSRRLKAVTAWGDSRKHLREQWVRPGSSYAAPMILLAQNRQDDRDRVQIEQDRRQAERNLNDTEYLAREVVAVRLAIRDLASKDFIRSELRALLEELEKDREHDENPDA